MQLCDELTERADIVCGVCVLRSRLKSSFQRSVPISFDDIEVWIEVLEDAPDDGYPRQSRATIPNVQPRIPGTGEPVASIVPEGTVPSAL